MRNQSSPTKKFGARLGDVMLSLLALTGGVCVVLVVLGITLNISIMMFRTGSMEPTIPTGSIAFVREIPATEMTEGDIITVDRDEDLLPVTHRVTEVQSVDAASGKVTFVMRGDANDTDDPEPYTASTVQRTMFSIPGVAPTIQSLQSPLVLGGLTLGATALVIWAFWPRNEIPRQRPRGAHAAHGVALPVLLALVGPVVMQQPMVEDHANVTTEEIAGEYIRLQSSGNQEQMHNMVPGQPVTWAVNVWVDAPEPGEIVLELAAAGQLATHADAMTAEVVLCTPHPTALLQCDPDVGYEHMDIDTSTFANTNSGLIVGSMSSEEKRRVLVTATLAEAPPESVKATSAEFQFIATGHNEQLTVGPGPVDAHEPAVSSNPPLKLSQTGLGNTWLIALGLLLLIGGILALVQHFPGSYGHSQDGTHHA